MIEYRKMLESDIPAGLALCRSAGWNQLENDWKLFLQFNPDGSRVAIDETSKVVGTVTTINYDNRFCWIGMVLVDPSKKRQGIGTQLLRESLKILESQETIKLDATPAGREVYLKLNFRDEYTLVRMMATNVSVTQAVNANPMNESDLSFLKKKDEEVFGASRIELLQRLRKAAPELSFVSSNRSGYCFGRKGYNYTHIGPVIADELNDAIQLTTAALKNISGPVIMDVMHESPFSQWLSSIGFSEQRKLIRMYLGTNAHPGNPSKQFAILGPEFG